MAQKDKKLKLGWHFCYMRGESAVFLNRWDQTIKEFDTYEEAETFANEHIELIDKKVSSEELQLELF